MAITLEEVSVGSVAMTLEDSVPSMGGACADITLQVKIQIRLR